mmetsp:Transcript_33527/g.73548  ORF Transcript_33527/g.73548 Transcript_33527/m.73548 type:complete len:102 (+) Transcript_33527:103-408(+)|eukprot:CAMPEP_0178517972 /NCGR_PEP_ID=MMETSP0696-20121128/25991_1 /TAXON_ID=265572 /ORGANISM="Extubocellulus spinifer, Strain CCMP396" /LENGTH=101 /DNA_ID=CAMNT_0020148469 /DNA_START=77 /DNA_END=382 /DNA_ORIENTATION=+
MIFISTAAIIFLVTKFRDIDWNKHCIVPDEDDHDPHGDGYYSNDRSEYDAHHTDKIADKGAAEGTSSTSRGDEQSPPPLQHRDSAMVRSSSLSCIQALSFQ